MPTNVIQELENLLKGLSVGELKNVLNDPNFRQMWKDIGKNKGKEAQQKIIVNAKVTGVKDVENLVEALNAAVGASEEYFDGLKKYRSVAQSMNLAWKEGAAHMKEYIETARKTGGQMAVIGAAGAYLSKQLVELVDSFEDNVMALKRFNIEQKNFLATSGYSAKEVNNLRKNLMLTKDEMKEFFDVLDKAEVQGFGTDRIEKVFKDLRDVYGKDAINKLQEFQDIIAQTPEMAFKLKQDPNSDLSLEAISNLMQSGQGSRIIEMRQAGLFGGVKATVKETQYENFHHKVEFGIERIKDSMLSFFPAQLLVAGNILAATSKGVGYLYTISGQLGALRSLRGGGAMPVPMTMGGRFKGALRKGAGLTGILATLGGLGLSSYNAGGIEELSLSEMMGGKAASNWKGKGGEALSSALGWGGLGATLGMRFGPWGALAGGVGGAAAGLTSTYWKDILGLFSGGAKGGSKKYEDQEAEATLNVLYKQTEQLKNQNLLAFQLPKELASGGMRFATAKGDWNDYIKGNQDYEKTIQNAYSIRKKEYIDNIEEIQKAIDEGVAKGGKEAFEASTAGGMAKVAMANAQKALVDLENSFLEEWETVLEKYTEMSRQGTRGYVSRLGLQQKLATAGLGFEVARMRGGEFEAGMSMRQARVSSAKEDMVTAQMTLKKAQDALQGMVGPLRIKQLELIKDLTEAAADKQREYNDAIEDFTAIDVAIERTNRWRDLMANQKGLINDLVGGYERLAPYWKRELEFQDVNIEAAKKRLDLYSGGDTKKREELAIALQDEIISKKKMELQMAKDIRDYKMEEVNFASQWLSEQADFMDEMGGYFGDVLAKRASALQKERENVAILQQYAESLPEGFRKQQAEVELEREKMKITKETIGIQKSSYEKFVGIAFGALGDVGFKKGRMEDVLTLGKKITEVQNRAGRYVGGGLGLTRNEVSALKATGMSVTGSGPEAWQKRGFVPGEELAQRWVQPATKPEMTIGGQIDISLSEDLKAKVKDWAMELATDSQFGAALARAQGLVTVNTKAKASTN